MNKKTYSVGYRKPPKQHQFKKGKSGNPKGRPKKTESIGNRLGRILGEKTGARTAGGEIELSMLDALHRQAVNQAVKGDFKALKIVLEEVKVEQRQRLYERPCGVLRVPCP